MEGKEAEMEQVHAAAEKGEHGSVEAAGGAPRAARPRGERRAGRRTTSERSGPALATTDAGPGVGETKDAATPVRVRSGARRPTASAAAGAAVDAVAGPAGRRGSRQEEVLEDVADVAASSSMTAKPTLLARRAARSSKLQATTVDEGTLEAGSGAPPALGASASTSSLPPQLRIAAPGTPANQGVIFGVPARAVQRDVFVSTVLPGSIASPQRMAAVDAALISMPRPDEAPTMRPAAVSALTAALPATAHAAASGAVGVGGVAGGNGAATVTRYEESVATGAFRRVVGDRGDGNWRQAFESGGPRGRPGTWKRDALDAPAADDDTPPLTPLTNVFAWGLDVMGRVSEVLLAGSMFAMLIVISRFGLSSATAVYVAANTVAPLRFTWFLLGVLAWLQAADAALHATEARSLGAAAGSVAAARRAWLLVVALLYSALLLCTFISMPWDNMLRMRAGVDAATLAADDGASGVLVKWFIMLCLRAACVLAAMLVHGCLLFMGPREMGYLLMHTVSDTQLLMASVSPDVWPSLVHAMAGSRRWDTALPLRDVNALQAGVQRLADQVAAGKALALAAANTATGGGVAPTPFLVANPKLGDDAATTPAAAAALKSGNVINSV